MNKKKLKDILENHKKGVVHLDDYEWTTTSWSRKDDLIKIILEAILEENN